MAFWLATTLAAAEAGSTKTAASEARFSGPTITVVMDNSGFMRGFVSERLSVNEAKDYREAIDYLRRLPGLLSASRAYFIPGGSFVGLPAVEDSKSWAEASVSERDWSNVFKPDFYGQRYSLSDAVTNAMKSASQGPASLFIFTTSLMHYTEGGPHLLATRLKEFIIEERKKPAPRPLSLALIRISARFSGTVALASSRDIPRYSGPLSAYFLIFGKHKEVGAAVAALKEHLAHQNIASHLWQFTPYVADELVMFSKLFAETGNIGLRPRTEPALRGLQSADVSQKMADAVLQLRPRIAAGSISGEPALEVAVVAERLEGAGLKAVTLTWPASAIRARLQRIRSGELEVQLVLHPRAIPPGVYKLKLTLRADRHDSQRVEAWASQWSMTGEKVTIFSGVNEADPETLKMALAKYPEGVGTNGLEALLNELTSDLSTTSQPALGEFVMALEVK